MKEIDRKKIADTDGMWEYRSLLYKPFIFGAVGVIVWYFLRGPIGFTREDQGVFEVILGIIGIAHGFIASMQIQKMSDQHDKIQEAIIMKDKNLFDRNNFKKLSPVIKFLLLIFSLLFFGLFLLYPFSSTYSGVVIIWATIFVLYLLWAVAAELADPFHGVWKITHETAEKVFAQDEKDVD